MTSIAADPFDVRVAVGAGGLLRPFNDVAVLAAADVHVARELTRRVGESEETVVLAVALAVRAPRLGHVFVDLATIRHTVAVEAEEPVDLSALPWPDTEAWLDAVGASGLVAVGEKATGRGRPLRLLGSRLYLDRYWHEERAVAADLLALAMAPDPPVEERALDSALARLFAPAAPDDRQRAAAPAAPDDGQRAAAPAVPDDRQRVAAASAVRRRLTVIAGGPGTGKTTTVARIVALLAEQAEAIGTRAPLIALTAPTGKAAARLEEAVRAAAPELLVDPTVAALLSELSAATVHRLLGWRPGAHSRFAHDREHRLPHDVIIVDETSMISLSLMASLAAAVRGDARLILVGDPGQLTSIEAGVVLGDIVAPAARPESLRRPLEEGIVVLERGYRFEGAIAGVANAIRRGDPDATVAELRAADTSVTWIAEQPEVADLEPVRRAAVASGRVVVQAARAGDADAALRALAAFRLLCAHRRGPHGVTQWSSRQQEWVAQAVGDLDLDQPDYVGRPLLVTANDYELGLYNGDTGVIVRAGDVSRAAFERGVVSPLRLGSVETVYAMTIHKSQGSQFDTAAVVLPRSDSPILTRELLYTAVTRARRRLILVGPEETVRAAVERPVSRASGLRGRLWGEAEGRS